MQQERAKHRVALLGPPKKLAGSNLAETAKQQIESAHEGIASWRTKLSTPDLAVMRATCKEPWPGAATHAALQVLPRVSDARRREAPVWNTGNAPPILSGCGRAHFWLAGY